MNEIYDEMSDEELMFNVMEKALKAAESRCDEVEFYGESAVGLSVEIEKWRFKHVRKLSSHGVGVRVVVSRRLGFSYTTEISEKALEKCVEEAVKRAKSSEVDADFRGLPSASSSYKTPVGTYDPQIVEICDASDEDAIAEVLSRSEEMLEGVRKYEQCRPTDGGFSVAYDTIFVMNSHGIEVSDCGTFVSAGITVVARNESGAEVSGSEGEAKRALRDLNPRWIGEEASRIAVESLGGEPAETKETAVILSPRAVQSILAYTTIPHLSAENVQRNRSPYKKTGVQIASEILTIVDDGVAPGRLNTRKMDGEGIRSQRTVVIERGVLKSFLYDSYTAAKDGVESTGNAVRGYDNTPAIGATNFCILGSEIATKEEIFEEGGVFVTDVIGAHTASPTSGDFSVVAHNAFAVKRGEMKPLKDVMLVGNSVEMLKRIALIASDSRQIYNVISPTILISKMQVVSAT